MENLSPMKKEELDKKLNMSTVSNFIRSALISKILNKTNINEELATRLYANRIIEEELLGHNKSFRGFTPELPKGSKLINVRDAQYVQINGRMYYVRTFGKGFDLVDNTYDFMPSPDELYPSKQKIKYQKAFNVSDTSEPIDTNQFYTYDENKEPLDNWIIHNDLGSIKDNLHTGEVQTWWLKGEPYKAMTDRSLFDKPYGRHLFARQSALEDSIGRPLDQHQELRGEVVLNGYVNDGGITITPT
jgi:hypothetical protein